jgi:hypothetical protein
MKHPLERHRSAPMIRCCAANRSRHPAIVVVVPRYHLAPAIASAMSLDVYTTIGAGGAVFRREVQRDAIIVSFCDEASIVDSSIPESQQPIVEYMQWRGFLRVKSHDKALKLLRRIATQLDQALQLRTCVPYWKDPALFEVTFITRLRAHTVEEMVFSALLTGGKLTAGWSVTGPMSYSNDKWEFRGLTKHTAVSGVEWIEFEVRNFELPADTSTTDADEQAHAADTAVGLQDQAGWIQPDGGAAL